MNMVVRSIDEVVAQHPDFKTKVGWERREDGGLENPKYGVVKTGVVCKPDGAPIYAQWFYDEANMMSTERGPAVTGAVTVPYFIKPKDGLVYLAMVKQGRPAVIDGKTGERGEMVSTELPRGFANKGENGVETALREGGEETRKNLQDVKYIGVSVANTTFFGAGVQIYSARFDPAIEGSLKPDAKEQILKMDYVALPDLLMALRETPENIYCGFTKGALMDFIASLPPEVMLKQMIAFYELEMKKDKK